MRSLNLILFQIGSMHRIVQGMITYELSIYSILWVLYKKSYMYIKVGLTHLFQLLFLNLLTYLLAQNVNSCNDR